MKCFNIDNIEAGNIELLAYLDMSYNYNIELEVEGNLHLDMNYNIELENNFHLDMNYNIELEGNFHLDMNCIDLVYDENGSKHLSSNLNLFVFKYDMMCFFDFSENII
jgi:hypothetical protein